MNESHFFAKANRRFAAAASAMAAIEAATARYLACWRAITHFAR